MTWSIALRGLEPSRAMSYLYCVPPLAVAIGALFLDEPVTLWLLLGGALVIGGVAVAQRGPARKAGMPPRPLHRRRRGATIVNLRKRLMLAGRGCDPRAARSPVARQREPRHRPGARAAQRPAGRRAHGPLRRGVDAAVDARQRHATRCPCGPADAVDRSRARACGSRARCRTGRSCSRTPLSAVAADRALAARGRRVERGGRRRACTTSAVILVGFAGGPDLVAAGQPDAAAGRGRHVRQPAPGIAAFGRRVLPRSRPTGRSRSRRSCCDR